MVKHSHIPEINPTWSWHLIFLNIVPNFIYCFALVFISEMIYRFLFCGVRFGLFKKNWNALFSMPETI